MVSFINHIASILSERGLRCGAVYHPLSHFPFNQFTCRANLSDLGQTLNMFPSIDDFFLNLENIMWVPNLKFIQNLILL